MKALAVEPTPPVRLPLSAAPRALQKSCGCGAKAKAGEDCERCAVQRKERNGAPGDRLGTPAVADLLATAGQPLAAPVREDMESRFGTDFGRVRIHDDAMAARAAESVDARAFTLGEHIAFAPGEYDPGSDAGRHLLAHELAHTIQQSRGGATVQGRGGPGEAALEREADAAADAVLAWRAPPPLSATAAGLARSKAQQPKPPSKPKPAKLKVGAQNLAYSVELDSGPTDIENLQNPLVTVLVDRFYLPGTKGVRAYDVYKSAMPSPLVRVPKDAGSRASLKQDRESTGELRANWLQRLGWAPDKADALWSAAGGDGVFPKVGGVACHMDHIVELQLGGSGQPINIQALDPKPNMDSGRQIRTDLADLAIAIADSSELGLDRAAGDIELKIRYKSIVRPGKAELTPCQKVEAAALKQQVSKKNARVTKPDRVPQQIMMREGLATLTVDKKRPTPIESDEDNHPVRLAIPGVILTTLRPEGKDKLHGLTARLDLETARLPLKDKGKAQTGLILFEAGADKPPVLKTNKTNVPIDLLYLSPGRITSVAPTAEGIGWTGEITPTHKFLPKLTIRSSGKDLTIETKLDADTLKKMSPIPGAKITDAGMSIQLTPDFKPEGFMAFEIAPAGRRLMGAKVKVYPDDGLAAEGDVELFIPGVKSATGKMLYKQRQWSMSARVETKDLSLPYLRDGELTATYDKGKFGAAGTLNLALPGDGSGSVTLAYQNSRWLFVGKGTIGHHRFGTIHVGLRDDGEEFSATGKATAEFAKLGLKPGITVTYKRARSAAEPTITGKGDVVIDRPKLKGKLDVDLLANGQFTAKGEVSYPIRDNMTAKLGIEIDAAQRVKTTGEARLTKPVRLFERRGKSHSITLFNMEVPIPGVSAGPIGLKFGVGAGITAGYGIGPGELKDVVVAGTLNPFDPDPDPVFDLTGTLAVTAGAELGFWLRGSLVADAVVGKATGSLTVGAGIEAKGGVSLTANAHYEKGKFAVGAVARAAATLDMRFSLTAGVSLTTFLGSYGPGAEWTWKLAEIVVPTGLGFAFSAPVSWNSVDGLKLPSPEEITWEPPKSIDAGDLLKRIFQAAKATEPAKEGA